MLHLKGVERDNSKWVLWQKVESISKPTVRKAETPRGERMFKKRMSPSDKETGKGEIL